jgi:uncharacterized RDD family membrane protein YckC
MSKLYITTTQNVPLFFTPASIGERMLGYIIDMIVKASYVISLYYLFRYLKLLDVFINMETWGQIALFLAIYSPVAFYSLVSESLMEGRTLGKMVVKTAGSKSRRLPGIIHRLFHTMDIQVWSILIWDLCRVYYYAVYRAHTTTWRPGRRDSRNF